MTTHMISPSELTIFDVNASAAATNRGFLVQYLETVKVWVEAYGTKREIYCEVLDDLHSVDPVARHTIFTQVKSYHSTPLGLNDEPIRHALYLFYRNAVHAPVTDCTFALILDGDLRQTDTLLYEWEQAVVLTGDLLASVSAVLEEIVSEELTKAYRRLKRRGISQEVLAASWNDEQVAFKRFPFTRFAGSIAVQASRKDMTERIRDTLQVIQRHIHSPVSPRVILARCLQAVMEASSQATPERRLLNTGLLDAIIQEDEACMVSKPRVDSLLALLTPALDSIQVSLDSLHRKFDRAVGGRPQITQPLISHVVRRLADLLTGDEDERIVVPLETDEKIRLNRLSGKVRETIVDCMRDFAQVDQLLQGGTLSSREITAMRRRLRHYYGRWKSTGATSDDIFWGLVDDISPSGADESITSACQVVVCYFFTTCEVFEHAATEQV